VRGYTTKEKAKITAGAVAALVITGWLVVLAIAFLSARRKRPPAGAALLFLFAFDVRFPRNILGGKLAKCFLCLSIG
jgi:hypothetical protein